MNISTPLWGPIFPSESADNSPVDSMPLANKSTGFSASENEANLSTISTSGDTYLWSFKMYWMIATPVTLATILAPFIAGSVLRYMNQRVYDNRAYFRLGLTMSALAAISVMDEFAPVLPYFIIFGVAYGLLALIMLVRTSINGRNEWIWAGFAITFAAAVAMDELVDAFDGVGITGFLPLIYLFLIWFRSEISEVLWRWLSMLNSFVGRSPLPERLRMGLSWESKIVVLCVYYAIAVPIYIGVPLYGTLCIFSIPLGVLAINRMISSFSNGIGRLFWSTYAILYSLSLSIDVSFLFISQCWAEDYWGELDSWCNGSPSPVFGFTCFAPVTYMFIGWISSGNSTHTVTIREQLAQFWQRRPGLQRRSTHEMERGDQSTDTVALEQIRGHTTASSERGDLETIETT